MRLRPQTIGALNLFGHQPGPLDEQDLRVARALADVATIGILHERAIRHREVRTEQLETALNNRITIEQAKGLLANAHDSDIDHAWERLRHHARSSRIGVSEIAQQLVTGDLRPDALLPGQTPNPPRPAPEGGRRP